MSQLQPLYEIRDRLQAAAIAGTGLLGEDFRLRRGLEGLRALAAVSPVFGKLAAGVTKLLEAEAADQPGLLLDVLALADAVAYTQGACGLAGELTDLPTGAGSVQDIPYSQLSLLQKALKTRGSGWTDTLRAIADNSPGYFTDIRLLPAVLAGLGDGSGETGEICANVLKQQGMAVIPLLKRDFRPDGKKDMARRAALIDEIAGDGERAWYLDMLKIANGTVRGPLIYALRHSEENYPLLRDLYLRERGAVQDQAIMAIASLTNPAAVAFTREIAKKRPTVVVQALARSPHSAHARLIATLLEAQMDEMFGQKQAISYSPVRDRLEGLLLAACGKSCPALLALLRQMAAWEQGDHTRWKTDCSVFQRSCHLNVLEPFLGQDGRWPLPAGLLARSVWENPHPDLCALAEELAAQYGGAYYACAVTACGRTKPPEAVWERFAPLLDAGQSTRETRLGILFGLGCLTREKALDSRWTAVLLTGALTPLGGTVPVWRPSPYRNACWGYSAAPLDLALCALDPTDPACTAALRDNLSKLTPQPVQGVDYLLDVLRVKGWKDYRGVLPALYRISGERVSPLDLEQRYRNLTDMQPAEIVTELEWFREEVRAKRMKVFVTWSEERIEQAIQRFRQEISQQ